MKSSVDQYKDIVLNFIYSIVFFKLFLQQKMLRRKIIDTPLSKIKSAAIGAGVEIEGKVYQSNIEMMKSPLTQKTCQTFIWKLQKLIRDRKGSRWINYHVFYPTPFLYIYDESKEYLAAIDLASCEFQEDIFDFSHSFDDSSFQMPDEVKEIFNQYNLLDMSKTNFLFKDKYRLLEKTFDIDEPLFVYGTIFPPPQSEKVENESGEKFGSLKYKLKRIVQYNFEKLKIDPKTILKYDQNGDHVLTSSEEKKLLSDIEKGILNKYKKQTQYQALSKTKFLFAANNDEPNLNRVYISKKHQEVLTTKLGFKSVILFTISILLFSLGVFNLMKKLKLYESV